MIWELPESDTYFHRVFQTTPEGFEIDHLKYTLKFCKRFRVAVDGGAHVGTWTAHLAECFQFVFAFEPAADTFECLVKNLEHYPNVSIKKAALGPYRGRCTIEHDPLREGNTGARVMTNLEFTTNRGLGGSGKCLVETVDDQEIVDLDFLKLDVEGAESLALIGAAKTIRRCSPVIMIECKEFNPPRNGGVGEAKRILADLRYKEVGGIRNDRVFLPDGC